MVSESIFRSGARSGLCLAVKSSRLRPIVVEACVSLSSESRESQPRRTVVVLYGRRAMGEPLSREAVAWAVDALMAGLDSPTLRILAGLQEPLWWSEVAGIFFRTREVFHQKFYDFR